MFGQPILAHPSLTKCLEKFGFNPYRQPLFRVAWMPSVMQIVGGFWMDKGVSEYRRIPRYGTDPKWILEKWLPAVTYGTPRSWEELCMTPDGFLGVGPFPHHGRYEHITTFTMGKGVAGYVPVTPDLIEMTAKCERLGRFASKPQLEIFHRDEIRAQEALQDQRFDEAWDEKQHSYKGGLTIGAHGSYNHQQEIEDYARRIERANAFINAANFTPGFKQN